MTLLGWWLARRFLWPELKGSVGDLQSEHKKVTLIESPGLYTPWKKSCTTWHVWNPVNNRIFTISTFSRRIFVHQQYHLFSLIFPGVYFFGKVIDHQPPRSSPEICSLFFCLGRSSTLQHQKCGAASDMHVLNDHVYWWMIRKFQNLQVTCFLNLHVSLWSGVSTSMSS